MLAEKLAATGHFARAVGIITAVEPRNDGQSRSNRQVVLRIMGSHCLAADDPVTAIELIKIMAPADYQTILAIIALADYLRQKDSKQAATRHLCQAQIQAERIDDAPYCQARSLAAVANAKHRAESATESIFSLLRQAQKAALAVPHSMLKNVALREIALIRARAGCLFLAIRVTARITTSNDRAVTLAAMAEACHESGSGKAA